MMSLMSTSLTADLLALKLHLHINAHKISEFTDVCSCLNLTLLSNFPNLVVYAYIKHNFCIADQIFHAWKYSLS
jgi:hypothetical protein